MVAAKERCLPSREAHPKAHDIQASSTGSRESYLWQRVERKPDRGHGQTARQERRAMNGRPVFVVNQFAGKSISSAGHVTIFTVRQSKRLDVLQYLQAVSQSGWIFDNIDSRLVGAILVHASAAPSEKCLQPLNGMW